MFCVNYFDVIYSTRCKSCSEHILICVLNENVAPTGGHSFTWENSLPRFQLCSATGNLEYDFQKNKCFIFNPRDDHSEGRIHYTPEVQWHSPEVVGKWCALVYDHTIIQWGKIVFFSGWWGMISIGIPSRICWPSFLPQRMFPHATWPSQERCGILWPATEMKSEHYDISFQICWLVHVAMLIPFNARLLACYNMNIVLNIGSDPVCGLVDMFILAHPVYPSSELYIKYY